MRFLWALSFLLFASLAQAAAHPFGADDLLRLKRLGDFDASADGKWLVYSVTTPNADENKTTSALWLQALDGAQPARQITSGVKHDRAPRFSPDGKRIAFVSDRDGAPQIFVLELGGGEPRALTNSPLGFDSPLWSPDGKFLVASSEIFADCKDAACNKARLERMEKSKIKTRVIERLMFRHWDGWRDGKRSHLFTVDASSGEARDLTPGELDAPPFSLGGGPAWDISPDGKSVAYAATHERDEAWSTNDDVYEVAIAGGPSRCLSCANKGRDTSPRYSPDGRYLTWTTQARNQRESDKIDLQLYDRQSHALKNLTHAMDNWSEEPAFTTDSKRVVFASVVAGRKRLFVTDLEGHAARPLVSEHANGDPHPLADGSILFTSSSMVHATELYRVAMTDPPSAPTQITHLNDFAKFALGKVQERHVKLPDVADEIAMQTWVVTPPGFDAHKKYPALFWIHGGPEGAFEDSWSYRWNPQVLASAGYVVYMSNPRGSIGYGQKYVEGVLRDWGGKPFQDLMRAADDLESLPYVDKKRIGAAGASYGGFMINWIQGHSKRFAALFCHDGVSDQETMYATDELYFPEAEFGGTPWTSDDYRRWSPVESVKEFATPELIVHGERDFRVPIEQGFLMYTLLARRGIPSKLIVFPDENHWVLKPGNSRLWYASMIDWFHRWLGGAAADPKALESAFSVTK